MTDDNIIRVQFRRHRRQERALCDPWQPLGEVVERIRERLLADKEQEAARGKN